MEFVQHDIRKKQRSTTLFTSECTFFKDSRITTDHEKDRLYLNLQALIQQLAGKINPHLALLAYHQNEARRSIFSHKEKRSVSLSENDKRLLMMGKPLSREGLYIYPIVSQEKLQGFIALWNEDSELQPLGKDLVEAYALLAAQNIEMHKKQSSLQAYAQSLMQEKKELEKVQEYNQNLLSITTHDLSSPLTAVSGYLEMIHDHLKGNTDKQKLQDYCQRIHSGVNDVSEMLSQLNEVIKHKKGFLQLQKVEVNINWLVKDICKVLKANAAQKQIELNVLPANQPIHAEVDVVKFKRIIYNLVSNAIKYTNSNRHIFVKVDTHEEDVKVLVKDEGIGISQRNLDDIFKPFVKIDEHEDRSTAFSKGLGLYISSYFVELMGGNIKAKSCAGKGSTFTVTIPRA